MSSTHPNELDSHSQSDDDLIMNDNSLQKAINKNLSNHNIPQRQKSNNHRSSNKRKRVHIEEKKDETLQDNNPKRRRLSHQTRMQSQPQITPKITNNVSKSRRAKSKNKKGEKIPCSNCGHRKWKNKGRIKHCHGSLNQLPHWVCQQCCTQNYWLMNNHRWSCSICAGISPFWSPDKYSKSDTTLT